MAKTAKTAPKEKSSSAQAKEYNEWLQKQNIDMVAHSGTTHETLIKKFAKDTGTDIDDIGDDLVTITDAMKERCNTPGI